MAGSRAAEGLNNIDTGADVADLERIADPARGRCDSGRHAPSLDTQDEVTTQYLLQAVLARDNLARAWRRVKSNKGGAGH